MGLFGFLKSKSAEEWFKEGCVYFCFDAKGNYDGERNNKKALDCFRHAVEQEHLEAQYRLGFVYDEMNEPEAALAAFQSAAEKGHEMAGLISAARRQFVDTVLRAVDLKSLPELRPLPKNPQEFVFVDETKALSEEQTRKLEFFRRQSGRLKELETKNFDNHGSYRLAVNSSLKLIGHWTDAELALLGDPSAQHRLSEFIPDFLRKTGDREKQAVSTYWAIRSVEQGGQDAIRAKLYSCKQQYDLNGHRYWSVVYDEASGEAEKVRRGELSEEEFSQWQKAYEQAAPQRNRAMEEYPDADPIEFHFQQEAPDLDRSKVKKLFENARLAYKNGKVKDARLAYQQAAMMGDAEAQFRYGRTLLPNYSLEKFKDEFFERRVFKNNSGALPVPPLRSLWEAVFWLVKSAKQGNPKACWEMFRISSQPLLSLCPDDSDMLYWMILTVRAELECPLGYVNDEDELFRPYSGEGLRSRYSAVREAAKQKKLCGAADKPNFGPWQIDPVGEALYRLALYYELDSRYDRAVPMLVQAAELKNDMAKAHLSNLKKSCWYGKAAGTVAMPAVSSVTPDRELLAYALNGDLDAAMCLADGGDQAWKAVVTTAVAAAGKDDPVCEYLNAILQNYRRDRKPAAPYHILYDARDIMSEIISEDQIRKFEQTEFRLFRCGMNMDRFLKKVNRARQVEVERKQERERELAMEELEEQLQAHQEKLAAFDAEMESYIDNLVTWRKVEDYGDFGMYARQSVIDQINQKRQKLKDEYDL